MKNTVLLALAFVACSSDQSPTATLDAAADGQPPDARADVAVDVQSDRQVVDAMPDAVLDAATAADVVDAAVDGGVVDAGELDAAGDAGSSDADAGDAPADGGAVTYDLSRAYAAFEAHVLWLSTCTPGESCSASVVDDPGVPPDCYIDTMGVHFNVGLFGLVAAAPDGGVGTVGNGRRTTLDVSADVRSAYTASGQRRNAHVMFHLNPAPSEHGATGIPGRTVSPDYADVWLLGCPIR